jgi:uncharacterized protein (TIGR02001 family)
VFSDAQFRAYSLSGGRPAGFLDFSWDDPSGAYAAASASAVATSGDGLQPLGLQLNAGYAQRLSSGTTLDAGIVHSRYSRYSSRGSGKSYTEVYCGIAHGLFSSRVYFSPHYFNSGTSTLYGELEGGVAPAAKLRLTAHAGLLVPLRSNAGGDDYRPQYDWRLGIARELGRLSLQAAWTGGGRGRDYYRGREHRRNRLLLGLSFIL